MDQSPNPIIEAMNRKDGLGMLARGIAILWALSIPLVLLTGLLYFIHRSDFYLAFFSLSLVATLGGPFISVIIAGIVIWIIQGSNNENAIGLHSVNSNNQKRRSIPS